MSGSDAGRSVNVLCASPDAPNSGMTSVDLAFNALAGQLAADRVVYWRLYDQSEWLEPVGGSSPVGPGAFKDDRSGLTYQNVRGRLDEFLDADAVVYWGDFMHMQFYLSAHVDILTKKMRAFSDRSTAWDSVYRHLLLRGQPDEVLDRVVSFGTTMSFNTPADYAGEYGTELNSFLSRVHRIWCRDSYSALIAQVARPTQVASCKGTDAAFLLGERDRRERSEQVGVFFGRSALPPEPLARLGRAVSSRLDLKPFWLPWGHEPAFWPMQQRKRFRAAWPGLEHLSSQASFGMRAATYRDVSRGRRIPAVQASFEELADQIARSRLIITDTYHLAINAWRLGTPAICVVDKPKGMWSVNSGDAGARRDKREDLYSQLECTKLLVPGYQLPRNLDAVVGGLADYLNDDRMLEVTHDRIADMTKQSRGWVVDSLNSLLARSDTPAAALSGV